VLSVLRLIRLTRITRIFKMSKNFQGLVVLATTFRKSAAALLMLFLFMLIFSIFFATLIYTFEGGDYDTYRSQYVRDDGSASPFESIPVSMWWTIVTMCTVGYGDQYPVTPIGKFIGTLTMFCGLIVLSLPITIIGANFNDEYRKVTMQEQRTAKEEKRKKREQELQEVGGQQNDSADAIQLIHELIEKSHEELRKKVLTALLNRENTLRLQIKEMLVQYNHAIQDAKSPLEEEKFAVDEVLFQPSGKMINSVRVDGSKGIVIKVPVAGWQSVAERDAKIRSTPGFAELKARAAAASSELPGREAPATHAAT